MEASAAPRTVHPPARRPARLLRMLGDERLVAEVRSGSEAAFEVIFDRHHRGILAFCRHMLSSREEAEDAVQHTFMAAYRDLTSSQKPIQLKAWLYTIARNRCLTVLRARRERPMDELDEPSTDGLAAEVQRRQDLRELLRDVSELPEDQRAALVLAEVGDVSHEEIAAVLQVPKAKVKALVFQARSSLAASRNARDTPCEEIREQLANLRGGSLRRTTLRRHLRECAGCRAFRTEVDAQRRALAIVLPVAPAIGLKETVLAGALGGGGAVAAGGAAAGGGAVASGAGALAAKALAIVTIAGAGAGGIAAVARDDVPNRSGSSGAQGGAGTDRGAGGGPGATGGAGALAPAAPGAQDDEAGDDARGARKSGAARAGSGEVEERAAKRRKGRSGSSPAETQTQTETETDGASDPQDGATRSRRGGTRAKRKAPKVRAKTRGRGRSRSGGAGAGTGGGRVKARVRPKAKAKAKAKARVRPTPKPKSGGAKKPRPAAPAPQPTATPTPAPTAEPEREAEQTDDKQGIGEELEDDLRGKRRGKGH